MKVDYVEHYGTDLTVVNAARTSFANESKWETLDVMSLLSPPDVTPDLRGWRLAEEGLPGHEMGIDRYRRLSDRDEKLVHYLAKHKHTSCFEHQGATLRLKVPIFIARQIQRHRTFSYNEISRRYVDSAPEFFWPDKWRKRAENVKQGSSEEEVKVFGRSWIFEHDMEEAKANDTVQGAAEYALARAVELYEKMLEAEVAPELARMILPQNMYTEFYATSNLRNWSHFLKLRLDDHAQYEVRVVAEMVRDILTPLFPVSMEALLAYE